MGSTQETVRITNPSTGVSATDGTWAEGTRRGQMAFISGQVAVDDGGAIVGKNDFELQAETALKNLFRMLSELGAKPSDLMMITVFVTDMKNRPTFARIRQEYFKDNPPASTMVEIASLVLPELLIEINGIALIK